MPMESLQAMPMESLPVGNSGSTGRDSIGIACRDSIGIGGGSLFRRVADKGSDTSYSTIVAVRCYYGCI